MLLFLKIMMTEFIAEMGDKTQLMLVAMTSRFKMKDIIIGTAIAILVLNGLAVLAGGLVGSLIPDWLIKIIAALAFMFFAITSLKSDDDEEEDVKESKFKLAPIAVFCTFFIAELGDKTQLTAIAFGANEGLSKALIVWLACSIGLFAADIIGMLVGYLMKSKTPDGLLNTLAFIIFAIFGVVTMHTGLGLFFKNAGNLVLLLTIAITILFLVVCAIVFIIEKKKQSR